MDAIPFGGWTPSHDHDLCAGGHPGGGSYPDENGNPTCHRCGRQLDLTPCGCGTPGHEHLSRSFCPVRMHDDRRAVARTPDIVERDRAVVARMQTTLAERGIDAQQLADQLGMATVRVQAMLDGERCLSAAEVGAISDVLGVRAAWLVHGTGDPTGQRRLDVIACPMPSDQS